MNARLMLTHLLALFAGIFIASGLDREPVGEPDEVLDPEAGKAAAKTRVRDDPKGHERELAGLADLRGDPDQLRRLRYQMIDEWGARKPFELLAYLERRPWEPYAARVPDWMRQLARDQPDALLEYAIRTGCRSSLECLATEGDPHDNLARFLALGEDRLPPDAIHQLFEHAVQFDPDFHLELARLESPELRAEAAHAIATQLLEAHRFEEVKQLLATTPEGAGHDALVGRIVSGFSDLYRGTTFVVELPPTSREMAIDALLRQMRGSHYGGAEADQLFHDLISQIQEKHLDEGRRDEIAAAIAGAYFDLSPHPDETGAAEAVVADRWIHYAETLAEQEGGRTLKLAAYQRAVKADRTRWPDLLQIEEPALRDLALASCVDILDSDDFEPVAAHIQDPAVRQAALNYHQWGNVEDNFDPFAPAEEYSGPLPWRIDP